MDNITLSQKDDLRLIDSFRLQGQTMSDPVMSPDGKFMWTGNEWVGNSRIKLEL